MPSTRRSAVASTVALYVWSIFIFEEKIVILNGFCSLTTMFSFLPARRYASAIFAVIALYVHLSVCLSHAVSVPKSLNVGSRKKTPHDSSGTLVFLWCKRSLQTSDGITPTGSPNAHGVGRSREVSGSYALPPKICVHPPRWSTSTISGVTTRGAVRQLPQGAWRRGAPLADE